MFRFALAAAVIACPHLEAAVTIQVLNQDKKPVQGASVKIEVEGGRDDVEQSPPLTDANGRFPSKELPRKNTKVLITIEPADQSLKTVTEEHAPKEGETITIILPKKRSK